MVDIYKNKPVGEGPLMPWLGELLTTGDPLDKVERGRYPINKTKDIDDDAFAGAVSYASDLPSKIGEDISSAFDFEEKSPEVTSGISELSADDTSLIGKKVGEKSKMTTGAEDLISSDAGETSWYDKLSPYEKFKMFSLGGEALGDIVSYGPKMTAAIGDLQARGALGMAPGSAIDPIKEVGPSSFAPDVAEMFAESERKKERKGLMKELTKLVRGGEDDVPEYGGVDDIISSMGPLQGLDSSSYEVKHKPSKLMLPKKKKEGEGDGAAAAISGGGMGGAGMGGGINPATMMSMGMGGEDDIWDHGVAVDIANRALEEGGNGDIVMTDADVYRFRDAIKNDPNFRFNNAAMMEEYLRRDKQVPEKQRPSSVQQQKLDLGPSRSEILNVPQVERMRDANRDVLDSEQIDITGTFAKTPGEVREFNREADDATEWDYRPVTDTGDEILKRVEDLEKRPPGQKGEPGEPGESPSDALTKIAAAMSVSDKLDFLDDRKENKKVKELERQMQALKQQRRADEDIEWMKLQQQKLKDSQIAPTQITPIRWS